MRGRDASRVVLPRGLVVVVVVVAALLGGCSAAAPAAGAAPTKPREIEVPRADDREPMAVVAEPAPMADGDAASARAKDEGPVPVTKEDPAWGSPTAAVTIVEFADFQCPFSRRAATTLDELRAAYGPAKLRIAWKNNPLPFHTEARPAAETAMALFQERGSAAFWAYYEAVYQPRSSNAGARMDSALYDGAFLQSGMSRSELSRALASGKAARKVEADIALAKDLGAAGTPTFFINGRRLSGAQPLERFREIVDAELRAAERALAAGTDRSRLYAELSKRNYERPEKPAPPTPPADDKTVHRVPIDGSPARGSAAALVTIVVFADFQDPFSGKVQPTLTELSRQYGDQLRFVWKNLPLAFHLRAEPAAELALEVRAQKGDAAFWKAHDLLFAQQTNLDDAALESIATASGANGKAGIAAVHAKKHAARIEADQDLADDLSSSGTPAFFINGRRLNGAQPIEAFRALIDQELVKARALVRTGTAPAQIYEAVQKSAASSAPPTRLSVPAPTKDTPTRGPANAKLTIHVFGDYQCPFTQRSMATLKEVEAAYPGQVRVVWHDLPLAFHANARRAAEAALEAFRQKGATGFWKMHDALFADQTDQGLGRSGLDHTAARLGLDARAFAAALDQSRHEAAIAADEKLASSLGISGTPSFVINGVLLVGAQPLNKFKKAIRLSAAAPGGGRP